MFSIDHNIPLQVKERDYGRGFDMMQKAQENQLRLQALREDYDIAKEKRDRQKAIRQGMASELQKMQQGTPAQYRTTFPQTMPTGQMPSGMTGVLMPQGMTGVLASERGKNLPQPALFGENILKGNFDISRELVSPEIAPKQPDIKDILTAQFNAAVANNDVATAFDAKKKLVELEKSPIKWGMNPQKGINPATGLPDTFVTNESGELKFLNVSPYEEPKAPKTSLVKTSLGYEVVKEGELPKGKPIEQTTQPRQPRLQKVTDEVEKAGAIADVKAEAKIRQELVNDAANVTKTYQILTPIIDNALTIVTKLPPDMMQFFIQSKLAGTPLNKYLGNKEQQQAITDYNVMLENLRLFIEKPAGGISNYEQGILGRAIGILEGNYSIEQKESVLRQVKGIFDNQNKVAENVLKQNKADKFIYNKEGKPLRFTKEANSQQRREYGEAIFEAKGDSELIREIQEHARELGVLE